MKTTTKPSDPPLPLSLLIPKCLPAHALYEATLSQASSVDGTFGLIRHRLSASEMHAARSCADGQARVTKIKARHQLGLDRESVEQCLAAFGVVDSRCADSVVRHRNDIASKAATIAERETAGQREREAIGAEADRIEAKRAEISARRQAAEQSVAAAVRTGIAADIDAAVSSSVERDHQVRAAEIRLAADEIVLKERRDALERTETEVESMRAAVATSTLGIAGAHLEAAAARYDALVGLVLLAAADLARCSDEANQRRPLALEKMALRFVDAQRCIAASLASSDGFTEYSVQRLADLIASDSHADLASARAMVATLEASIEAGSIKVL